MRGKASPRQGLGRRGEVLAASHLAGMGYEVLERNVRCPGGEIDLVTRDGDCLALVEVRTRRGVSHGSPEESITPTKQARMRRLAEGYVAALPEPPAAYRVDVVAVELSPAGALLRVELIKDALA